LGEPHANKLERPLGTPISSNPKVSQNFPLGFNKKYQNNSKNLEGGSNEVKGRPLGKT
jgi:hypothetical protein